MVKDKKNNKKVLIIITFLILILFFIIYYFVYINKPVKEDKNKENSKIKKEDNWFIPLGNASKIDIYSKDDNNYPMFVMKEDENYFKFDDRYKIINTYRCEVSMCKNYGINHKKNEVIIKDNGYVIYNYKKNKALKIKLPDAEYNSIEFLSNEDKDYGLAVANINNLYGFYSLEKETFTTDFKYTNIFTSEVSGLVNGNISAVTSSSENPDDNRYYIISYNSGEVKKDSNVYLGSFGNNKYVYYYENFINTEGYDAIIYNDSFEPILGEERYALFAVTSSGNLVVKNNDNNTFSIYTKKGKLIKKSKEYKKISIILNDYVVVVDNDDYLKIVDVDGNVVAKYMKMSDNYIFYETLSGIDKINNEKSISLVIENTNVEEDAKDRILKYYYILDSKEKGVIETKDVGM